MRIHKQFSLYLNYPSNELQESINYIFYLTSLYPFSPREGPIFYNVENNMEQYVLEAHGKWKTHCYSYHITERTSGTGVHKKGNFCCIFSTNKKHRVGKITMKYKTIHVQYILASGAICVTYFNDVKILGYCILKLLFLHYFW